MPQDPPETRPKPARVTGPKHLIAAGLYSLAGAKRLWHETAFRIELFAAIIVLCGLAFLGATAKSIVIFVVLMFVLIAVEALNTAIECIVDHVSPSWSEFARDAKDLGSFAVLCLVLANGFYVTYVGLTLIFSTP
jgi:diacylglycerol kinase (ATP)